MRGFPPDTACRCSPSPRGLRRRMSLAHLRGLRLELPGDVLGTEGGAVNPQLIEQAVEPLRAADLQRNAKGLLPGFEPCPTGNANKWRAALSQGSNRASRSRQT